MLSILLVIIGWRAGAIVVQLARSFYISLCPTRINCSTLYATPVGPHGIPERLRRKLYVYFENTTSTFRICGICRYTVVGATVKSGSSTCIVVGRKRSACFAAESTHRSMLLSRRRDKPGTCIRTSLALVISSASYFCVLNTRSLLRNHTPVQADDFNWHTQPYASPTVIAVQTHTA